MHFQLFVSVKTTKNTYVLRFTYSQTKYFLIILGLLKDSDGIINVTSDKITHDISFKF